MKKFIFLITLFFVTISFATEPENLSNIKQGLKKYHDSGAYFYEISQVEEQALDYLRTRVNENNKQKEPKKLAIVLDIDETSLSNYMFLLKHDFSTQWDRFKKELHGTVISPTLHLVQFAQSNNVSVFFVTGRSEKMREMTEHNLKEIGYDHWVKLYMEPNDYHLQSVVPYKSAARKEITNMGYDIVINVGDQYSDLKGGYADRAYKLPDPYYYLP